MGWGVLTGNAAEFERVEGLMVRDVTRDVPCGAARAII
jgi:hypothetical protein